MARMTHWLLGTVSDLELSLNERLEDHDHFTTLYLLLKNKLINTQLLVLNDKVRT